jgi:hypothetical protein
MMDEQSSGIIYVKRVIFGVVMISSMNDFLIRHFNQY